MNINNIKKYLRSKVGCNIVIIYYGNRNKKEKYNGILYKLYGNIFTIRLLNGEVKSFSYIDVLTKTVQIYI